MKVAIVGGGVGGLACAEPLAAAGVALTLFDKGRKLGGRCSTRRVERGEAEPLRFDHGAQYFTARDDEFVARVEAWARAGQAARWQPRLWALEGEGGALVIDDDVERWVCVPTMSTIATLLHDELVALGAELELQVDTRVTRLERVGERWLLVDARGGSHGLFDHVVLDMPPAQAAALLAEHAPALEQRALACRMDPCWALMLEPREPFDPGFDAAFVSGSPLAWLANEASKPGRDATPRWVLHAEGGWSQANLERSADEVGEVLVAELARLVGCSITAASQSIHRWRYAKPEPLPEAYLLDLDTGLAACGDWLGGPRVEGAFRSGRSLGKTLLA